jgi:hypothetical protein
MSGSIAVSRRAKRQEPDRCHADVDCDLEEQLHRGALLRWRSGQPRSADVWSSRLIFHHLIRKRRDGRTTPSSVPIWTAIWSDVA